MWAALSSIDYGNKRRARSRRSGRETAAMVQLAPGGMIAGSIPQL